MPGIQLPYIARAVTPLGSRLLGTPSESPRQQRIRVMWMLIPLLLIANFAGAVAVIALITVVIPGPNVLDRRFLPVLALVVPIYTLAAVVLGTIAGTVSGFSALRWVTQGRSPTRREQVAALGMPWRLTAIQAVFWCGAAIAFTIAFGVVDSSTIPKVAFTIGFSGATVCAFCYLLSEFSMRPIAALVLQAGDPRRIRIARVTFRALMTWVLGTGVPVVGLMLVALFSFSNPVTSTQLAVSILAIGAITIVFGYSMTRLGARATVDPIRAVTNAMARIERGHDNERVVVYDGTELGELQSGFNRMADGLRERERIRELFGRHVGHEVAEAALRRKPQLGGEERDVAVFFIDLVGSTQIAASRPPQEVVDLLNRFFDVVVEEVDNHGGFINKFEGDAALAIFGAPVELDDHPGQALATARRIRHRLPLEVPDCTAAIGVAYGTAVAGNIGARSRFEYTVIGDPINEAARLCELAKHVPTKVLASGTAVEAASDVEAANWILEDNVTLRGRSVQTRLASPID